MKITGIYKITSPSNRIYIGQSINILNRFKQYKYFYEDFSKCLIQKSIKKYGYTNHIFEVIEQCNEDRLNEREIYWIDFYKSNVKKFPNSKGLNFTDGGDNPPRNFGRIVSDKSKNEISLKNCKNFADKRINNIHQYDINAVLIKIWNANEFNKNCTFKYPQIINICKGKGFTHKGYVWRFENDSFNTFETKPTKKIKVEKIKVEKVKKIKPPKIKIVKEKKPRPLTSEETKQKMSESQKKIWTDERKEHFSKMFKGREAPWKKEKHSKEYIEKRMSKIRKPIIQYDLEGNFIKEWESAKSAERDGGYHSDRVSWAARGILKKYRNFIWKYKIVGELQTENV